MHIFAMKFLKTPSPKAITHHIANCSPKFFFKKKQHQWKTILRCFSQIGKTWFEIVHAISFSDCNRLFDKRFVCNHYVLCCRLFNHRACFQDSLQICVQDRPVSVSTNYNKKISHLPLNRKTDLICISHSTDSKNLLTSAIKLTFRSYVLTSIVEDLAMNRSGSA